MKRTIRLALVAAAALGAALPGSSQAACPLSPYTVGAGPYYVQSDCHLYTDPGTGWTGVTAAQTVCITPANCFPVGRTGVYYDSSTNQVCYAYTGNGWYCR